MLLLLGLQVILIFGLTFGPTLFWWQSFLLLVSIVVAHGQIVFVFFKPKKVFHIFLLLLLSLLVLNFYWMNWISKPKQQVCENAASFGFNENKADLVLSHEPLEFAIVPDARSRISLSGNPRYSLNQELGKVAIVKIAGTDAKLWNIAYLSSPRLFSKRNWNANRILLRRLASILRQQQEPVVVVFDVDTSGGSGIVKGFVFQARLDTVVSLNPLSSLVGIRAPLILGRGVSFCQSSAGRVTFNLIKTAI